MSKRPIATKQRRKVAKAFRAKLPAYINLVEWLVMHEYAATRRAARELILDHRVVVESHVLGIDTRKVIGPDLKIEEKEFVWPFIKSELATSITVLPAA